MARKKQFLVIGLGSFGGSVVKSLVDMGYEVLAIDSDEYIVQEFSEIATHIVQADATDEIVLRSLGVANFDVAIVAMAKDLEASILITVLLKEIGVPCVVSKAEDELHGKILQKIGADRVVYPERDMGIRTAHNLVSSSILEYIELSTDYSIIELNTPKVFIGKSLREMDLRHNFGVSLVAINRDTKMIVIPPDSIIMQEGDSMVVIGHNENLHDLEKAAL